MTSLVRLIVPIALTLPLLANGAETMLTSEQVAQCVRDRQEVIARNQELTAKKTALDARGDALIQNESRMKDAQNSLKPDLAQLQLQQDELKRRTNDMAAYFEQAAVVKKLSAAYKERVDRYNADVRAHQVLLDQYNADVTILNPQLDALDAQARSVDRRCVKNPAKRADINAAKSAAEEQPRKVLTPETRILP